MHPVLRSVLAVAGGYLVMVVGVAACSVLAAKLQPELLRENAVPAPNYLAVNLAYSLAAAVAGGFAAGWFAGLRPVKHAAILAGLVLVLGLVSAKLAGNWQPNWYEFVLVTAMPPATILGGFLSARLRLASEARANSR